MNCLSSIFLVTLIGEKTCNGIMIVLSEKTDASANLIFLLLFLLLFLLVIKQKCNIVVFRSSKSLVNGNFQGLLFLLIKRTVRKYSLDASFMTYLVTFQNVYCPSIHGKVDTTNMPK